MAEPAFTCRIAFTPDGGAAVVSLAGTMGPEAVQELHPRVQDAYRAGARRFIFDLSALQHTGSVGLRLLLGLRTQVKGEGRVVICSPSGPVLTILNTMKLEEVLPVYATREEALEAARI